MNKVGFFGAGKIAQALARGVIASGLSHGSNITASSAPQDAHCVAEFRKLGANAGFDNKVVAESSDLLILAVKPPAIPTVLNDVRNVLNPQRHTLVSVAMGVSLETLENLAPEIRIIRAMPNTACLAREGATVFVPGKLATEEDKILVQKVFSAVGTCHQVSENLLDPITALSGSGPAYIYLVVEALADGAVRQGVPRDLALQLATQTVVGAGKMVQITGTHPAQLRDDVTSPKGSTAAGLFELEQGLVRAAFNRAIQEATQRCKQESLSSK